MSEDKAALEHKVKARVRYGETDQMGVVYHANYLSFFEIARTELIRLREATTRAWTPAHPVGGGTPAVPAHL